MKLNSPRSAIPLRQYRRAMKFVSPYWRGLLAVMLLGLFSTAVGLIQPYISRLLIDDALIRRDLNALWKIAVAMVVVTVIGFVLNAISSYCYTRLSAESLFSMRLDVYEHLQKLSPRYFARHKLGDIVSRINNDIGEVQRVCSDTLLSVLSNVLFLVGSVCIMLWLNTKLTVASLCLLPVSIFALRHYQRKLVLKTGELRQCSSDLGSFLIESLMGIRLIVTSGSQGREVDRFRGHNAKFVGSLLSMQMMSFMASALPGTVLTLSTATVFLYGGRLVIQGHLTIGAFVAFMAYHVKLLAPVQNLLGIYTSLLTGGVSLGRVFEILDVPIEVKESATPKILPAFAHEIRFDHVAFRYSPDVPVLEDVSFAIPKGSFCAVVGPSGAGKSTIGDLLVRFFDVQHGSVTLDGCDIREAELSSLRSTIAVVEQTPYFFRASIRENMAYARPDATLSEIHSCAESAGIHRFIQSLPDGYETMIGERGSTLSVGERQRIALARALLRNPSILILDEPTSALDAQSEAIVTEELKHGLCGRTTLVITHRPSLVEVADMVLLLENGRIVERGETKELLKESNFLAMQLRDVTPGMTEAVTQ
jgi:ATP-binding cassette, subfamily B, bacterial